MQNLLATTKLKDDSVMRELVTSNSTMLCMLEVHLQAQTSSIKSLQEERIDSMDEQFTDSETQLVFAAQSNFFDVKSMEDSYEDLLLQGTTLSVTITAM